MRRILPLALVALTAAGCVTPVVLEDPATRQRVNCTVEAQRIAYDASGSTTGAEVPFTQRGPAGLAAYDLEQQCVGTLLREGFVCVAGCPAPRP